MFIGDDESISSCEFVLRLIVNGIIPTSDNAIGVKERAVVVIE